MYLAAICLLTRRHYFFNDFQCWLVGSHLSLIIYRQETAQGKRDAWSAIDFSLCSGCARFSFTGCPKQANDGSYSAVFPVTVGYYDERQHPMHRHTQSHGREKTSVKLNNFPSKILIRVMESDVLLLVLKDTSQTKKQWTIPLAVVIFTINTWIYEEIS